MIIMLSVFDSENRKRMAHHEINAVQSVIFCDF